MAGAFGAQACQAEKIRAACDCGSFQDTPNTCAVCSGNALMLNSVMPKPAAAPAARPVEIGLDAALACGAGVRAWLSIMVTCWRPSQVRLCDRANKPWPPPIRWPEMPTVGQLPPAAPTPARPAPDRSSEQRNAGAHRDQARGLVDDNEPSCARRLRRRRFARTPYRNGRRTTAKFRSLLRTQSTMTATACSVLQTARRRGLNRLRLLAAGRKSA